MIKINYVGLKCGICGSDFDEHDDVVVCPDCGTPMHRLCYKENSVCPNSDKHADGYIFDGFDKIKESAQGKSDSHKVDGYSAGQAVCPICGEKNKSDASFCNYCGTRLRRQANPVQGQQYQAPFAVQAFDPLAGMSADTEFEENVNASDMACYVAVNTPYYLTVFNRLKQKMNRFNFSAAVFSGVWFLYRKQYKIGSILLSINILLYSLRYFFSVTFSMPVMEKLLSAIGVSSSELVSLTMEQYVAMSGAIEQLSLQEQFFMVLPTIVLILQIVLMVLVGLNANKMYYKHCVKKIQFIKSEAVANSLSKEDTVKVLSLSGGVNIFVAFAFALFYFLFYFVV